MNHIICRNWQMDVKWATMMSLIVRINIRLQEHDNRTMCNKRTISAVLFGTIWWQKENQARICNLCISQQNPTSRDLSAPLPGTEASAQVYSMMLRQPVALNGVLLRNKRRSKRRHVKRADSSLCEERLIQPQQIQGDLGSLSAGNKRLKQDTWWD